MVKKEENHEYGEFAEADVVKSAFIDGVTFYSKPVLYTEVDGMALFEGDIILGSVEEVEQKTEIRKEELRSGVAMGLAISGSQYRWANCTVPYTIDSTLPNQSRVTDAIAHWEANTRYRFVLRTSANSSMYPDWVNFRPSTSGCSSYVGRQGGMQPINLASGCSTGNTIHEIGHAIGLWHEHSREDRDSRVTINWSKIIPGREHNFSQHIADGDDLGLYDYGSVMHYPRTAFSIDGSETITPTDPSAVIGQRTGLSPGDITAANSLCPVTPICPPSPLQRRCPPAPIQLRCPPAPVQRRCPPAPIQLRCPPAPAQRRCPPAPVQLRCPPAPVQLRCPPAPRPVGCQAGPYLRPGPRIPVPRRPRVPGYGYYGQDAMDPVMYDYGYDYYAYADPYGYDYGIYEYPYMYGMPEADWTRYEYSDPYGDIYYQDDPGYEEEPFDPRYYY